MAGRSFVKFGVRMNPSREIRFAMGIAAKVYFEMGYDFYWTSGGEGNHSPGSLHYQEPESDAFDSRPTPDPYSKAYPQKEDLEDALNSEAKRLHPEFEGKYEVVYHSTHIHIEFERRMG